jgi:hypothetical protein
VYITPTYYIWANGDKDRLYYYIMKFSPIIFLTVASAAINNYQVPLCQNCIHYRPNLFSPSLSKCSQFGNKDFITGEINYEYADLSRMNEDKCGLEGKQFNETSFIIQEIQNAFIHKIPTNFLIVLFFLSILLRKLKE